MAEQARNTHFGTQDDEAAEMSSIDDEMPDFANGAIGSVQHQTANGVQHTANGIATARRTSRQADEINQVQAFEPEVVQLNPEREHKEFAARQVQMMAIGTAIGNGLLFQSGKALYLSGPVSLLLSYMLIGTVVYSVMITLGEMITLLPVPGGFFTLANRCVSRAIGFLCGWSYWFGNSIGVAGQLVALQEIMQFWDTDGKLKSVWILIFFITTVLFNLLNVRRFGHIEYWLTAIKVTTIVGLIFLGVLLPMGASVGTRRLGTAGQSAFHNLTTVPCPSSTVPCLDTPGFPYWNEGAVIPYIFTGSFGRLVGFWLCCCQATFSYTGVEMIGIAAFETERQRDTLPRAVRRVSYRVVFYYVGAVFVLGLNVSVLDPILKDSVLNDYTKSPFVLMVQRAGIAGLPSVINAVALIAALSVANISLYMASRTLHALANEGQAPRGFKARPWLNVPVYSVLFSSILGLLAFMSVSGSRTSTDAFDFLDDLTVVCAVFPWAVICGTYLRFRQAVKAQRMVSAIPKAAISPLQPYLALYGLGMSSLILIFSGYAVFTRNKMVWKTLPDDWGISLSPWVTIGVLCLLLVGWLARKQWSFHVPPIRSVDIHNGTAVVYAYDKSERSKFWKAVLWVLDKI